MAMTSRERWLALLDGRRPDRIPTDYWATGEVTSRLVRELGSADADELMRRLHVDRPVTLAARRSPGKDGPEGLWGIRRRRVDYGGGSYDEAVGHPLAEATDPEQIHRFPWPSGDDHDFDEAARRIAQLPAERPVFCGHYEPFLVYCAMRGREQAMMDLLMAPEMVEAALDHLFDFHYRLNERMFELAGGRIDFTIVAEDLGSQTGLLIGLEQIRRFLLPRQKKMADLARSHGIRIFYHTDGAAREVIPDLIDVVGIDILNPIQWRCPCMDREGLVRDFGERVVFHGAIDNQYTLSRGTLEEVRAEVLESIEIFASARWICAPCHNIQPVSPSENILALYRTIHEFGRL